jgi:hypothetical protein
LAGKGEWDERTLFVHSQRVDKPIAWRQCAVMTERWRLVDGKELYDIAADPGQTQNVAEKNETVVDELRAAYLAWYADISERFHEFVRIELGGTMAPNPVHLTCHDWHAPISEVPWNQEQIRSDVVANGYWAVDVRRAGRYEVTLRSRPASAAEPLNATRARLLMGSEKTMGSVARDVPAGTTSVTLPVDLQKGPQLLQTRLESGDGATRGAYFVEVRYVE